MVAEQQILHIQAMTKTKAKKKELSQSRNWS
jgi:hypothetical protein